MILFLVLFFNFFSFMNLEFKEKTNNVIIDDKLISLVNERFEYKGKIYIINLSAKSNFGDDWGSFYGAREGKLFFNPEIEIDGLNYIMLPKENKTIMEFFNTFWNFFPKMQTELNKINNKSYIFYVESVSFETFNHPDKWWMNVLITGNYNQYNYNIVIEFIRPEDGPLKEEIVIKRVPKFDM